MSTEGVGKYYCLKEGRSYIMKIADTHGDGLIKDEGNYTAYLDDAIVFVSDGTLEFKKSYTFIVGTKVQKCKRGNSKKVIYVQNGKKKKCDWIKPGKSRRILKHRCNKKKYKGKKIKKRCPKNCGLYAGVGDCKFLYSSG